MWLRTEQLFRLMGGFLRKKYYSGSAYCLAKVRARTKKRRWPECQRRKWQMKYRALGEANSMQTHTHTQRERACFLDSFHVMPAKSDPFQSNFVLGMQTSSSLTCSSKTWKTKTRARKLARKTLRHKKDFQNKTTKNVIVAKRTETSETCSAVIRLRRDGGVRGEDDKRRKRSNTFEKWEGRDKSKKLLSGAASHVCQKSVTVW